MRCVKKVCAVTSDSFIDTPDLCSVAYMYYGHRVASNYQLPTEWCHQSCARKDTKSVALHVLVFDPTETAESQVN